MTRDAILDRIRRACTSIMRAKEMETRLRTHSRGPLPCVPEDRIGEFAARARALATTVLGPVAAAQAPHTVAEYLRVTRLPCEAVIWPSLAALDWSSARIETHARAARDSDAVGITAAYCAIAETGTLMLLSGPQTPATVSLLPATHVALLSAERIVARMEDGFDLLRHEHRTAPRAINFVSGPSRTADVEQTVTLGAHGPSRVAVVLVTNALPIPS